jgi:hypothetical protein
MHFQQLRYRDDGGRRCRRDLSDWEKAVASGMGFPGGPGAECRHGVSALSKSMTPDGAAVTHIAGRMKNDFFADVKSVLNLHLQRIAMTDFNWT